MILFVVGPVFCLFVCLFACVCLFVCMKNLNCISLPPQVCGQLESQTSSQYLSDLGQYKKPLILAKITKILPDLTFLANKKNALI